MSPPLDSPATGNERMPKRIDRCQQRSRRSRMGELGARSQGEGDDGHECPHDGHLREVRFGTDQPALAIMVLAATASS
jgi:hypothetical protein